MDVSTKSKRLLRRYPILAPVPDDKRPALVKKTLRNPLLLLIVGGGGLLLLPLYFKWAFFLLLVAEDSVFIMQLAKIGVAILLPIAIAVPLLSRCVMPYFLRQVMEDEGYLPSRRAKNSTRLKTAGQVESAGQTTTVGLQSEHAPESRFELTSESKKDVMPDDR